MVVSSAGWLPPDRYRLDVAAAHEANPSMTQSRRGRGDDLHGATAARADLQRRDDAPNVSFCAPQAPLRLSRPDAFPRPGPAAFARTTAPARSSVSPAPRPVPSATC